MSGLKNLFGGNQQSSTITYSGLQVQTSTNTLPIPIVWGVGRLAPNVVWYDDFQNTGSGGKGGGGGGSGKFGSGGTSAQYFAALIMALCEGPIEAIGQIWKDQSIFSLADLELGLFPGSTPQEVWSWLEANFPSQALAYQGTAYVAASSYQLTSSATIDNHNFEIYGLFAGTGVNGDDADPALVINDFLTNLQYGVFPPNGFPSSSIDTTTLFGSGGDASLQTYCKGVGLCFSPVLNDQEQASSILQRWLQLLNTAAVWSGGQLKFIPYGDTATTAGTIVSVSEQNEIESLGEQQSGWTQIIVAAPADFVADQGVSYVNGGPLTFLGNFVPTTTPAQGTYSISPPGTYWFGAPDGGSSVIINYQYQVAASFTPNVTPIYNLTDDDFQFQDGEDPIQIDRSDGYEAFNVYRLEISARGNGYNLVTVEARDQGAIEKWGMRIAPSVTAHEICDVNVAAISAQLMLQRSVYIRNTYKFKLSWEYCLLDPMDLVTVADDILGLDNAAIRITDIEEDENGFLDITAEEFPLGVAGATLYPVTYAYGSQLNRNAPAQPVNAPIIFEPTAELAESLQIWIAVSGPGGFSSGWGGCNVFLSNSEAGTYQPIGTVNFGAPMGVLTGDLPVVPVNPAGTTTDPLNLLSVNLAESGGVLPTVSEADLAALDDPCYVGGEIVCFGVAQLVGANNYSLSNLARGVFGTEDDIVDHPTGTPFAFLNAAIFKDDYPSSLIGTTVFFKFASFNAFGGGAQTLDECVAYPYTITGAALTSPLPSVTDVYSNYEAGYQKIYFTEVSDFRSGIVYEVRKGPSWQTGLFLGTVAHPPFIAQGDGLFWISARCQPLAGVVVYSEDQVDIEISGNQLSLTYAVGFDEGAANFADGTLDYGLSLGPSSISASFTVNAIAAAAVSSGLILTLISLPSLVGYGFYVTDVTTPQGIETGTRIQTVATGGLDYGHVTLTVADTVVTSDYGSVADSVGSTVDYGSVTDAAIAITVSQGFTAGTDYGSVSLLATTLVDYGSVADSVGSSVDYGTVTFAVGGGVQAGDTIQFTGVPLNVPLYYEPPSSHWLISQYLGNGALNCTTEFAGVDFSSNFLAVADFLDEPDFLGETETAFIDGWAEIATAQSIVGGLPQWSEWQIFVPGVFPATAWKLRVGMESSAPDAEPVCSAFAYNVNFPTRTDNYLNQSVPSTGLTIVFTPDGSLTAQPFNAGVNGAVIPRVQVDWQAQTGDTYQMTGLSLSQLTLTFFNSSNVAVTRTGVTVVVQGA